MIDIGKGILYSEQILRDFILNLQKVSKFISIAAKIIPINKLVSSKMAS